MTPLPAHKIYSVIDIKEGDTARVLYDTITLGGQYVNLAGATVNLLWYSTGNKTTSTKTATIVNSASGSVSYQLVAADVAEPDVALLEWDITFGTGNKLRAPTSQVIKLNIIGDLAD